LVIGWLVACVAGWLAGWLVCAGVRLRVRPSFACLRSCVRFVVCSRVSCPALRFMYTCNGQ